MFVVVRKGITRYGYGTGERVLFGDRIDPKLPVYLPPIWNHANKTNKVAYQSLRAPAAALPAARPEVRVPAT